MSESVAPVRSDDRWLWGVVGIQLFGAALGFAGSGGGWTAAVPVLLTVVALYFAYRDWHELARSFSFERFHWLWGMIPPVYVIGRGVFLYRATGSGLIPLVVLSVLLALGYILRLLAPLGGL